MPPQEEQSEMVQLLRENRDLLAQNTEILKKLQQYTVVGMVARAVWFIILIGLPFALFYMLAPYTAKLTDMSNLKSLIDVYTGQ